MTSAHRPFWLLLAVLSALAGAMEMASAHLSGKPNVVYFLVDNLGMAELSSYNGGPLHGTSTPRIYLAQGHRCQPVSGSQQEIGSNSNI